jgi:CubicO group peptidase (beta-lactamase class C family)
MVPQAEYGSSSMRLSTMNKATAAKTFQLATLALAAALQSFPVLATESATQPSQTAQVDEVFARWDSTVSPGCSVAVMKNGAIIHQRGYGMADLEHDVPNTPLTVFHVASVSKQFTAAAIALLAQQGKLSLDDSVRKYVPELPDLGTPITIRQLVHHTSGLRDQWELLGLAGWRYSLDLITDEDVMSVVTRQKELNFAPNSQFTYSNTGYTLLAQIVARVSGQSFREFTTNRIFRPLGMHDTHFRDDFTEIVPRMAYGYVKQGEAFKTSVTNFNTVGATSLITTVEDLLQWDENFYVPRVGGAAFVEQMLQRGVLNDGKQIVYAFALNAGEYRGLRTVSHSGADAGYRAQLMRFADQHFSVACLCNDGDANPTLLTQQVADIYLAEQLQPVAKERADAKGKRLLSQRQLQAYAGTYLQDDGGMVLRVTMKDGKLQAAVFGDRELELTPLSASRFSMIKQGTELDFSGGARQQVILSIAGSTEPLKFERVPKYEPTAEQLSAFTGTYESEEVDMLYRVKVDNGALTISSLKRRPVPMRAVMPDMFETEMGNLSFQRDATGIVRGYMLNSERIKNFRFIRSARR